MPQSASPPPPPLEIAGRAFVWGERTYVMGVINCTPDSFSGDGLGDDREAALRRGARMLADGADILDVGAESTRPGFRPVAAAVELARAVPVVELLVRELGVPVSIDTTKGVIACAALEAGASIVNDVSGLCHDREVAACVAEHGAVAVAMHNQRNRPFHDVIGDTCAGLEEALKTAAMAGVPRERLIVDPGFGFGWRAEQNLELLRRLGELRALGRPVLVGTSRKSAIGAVLGLPVEERLEGTAATVALAIANGADLVRVHDVREMVRVARMSDAVVRGWTEGPEDGERGDG